MTRRFSPVALGMWLLMVGCYDEATAPGFCEHDCAQEWTQACLDLCAIARPAGCTAARCPILMDASFPATDGGGVDDGGGSGGEQDSAVGNGPCGDPCPTERPICDEVAQVCLECSADYHCLESESGPYCLNNACVECVASDDCQDATAAQCDTTTHQCVGCQSDADCSGVRTTDTLRSALQACNTSTGQCVECTGANYLACGVDEIGRTRVCDSSSSTCSSRAEGVAGLCGSCVSDAHCQRGMRCVLEVFEGQELEPVCLWDPNSGVSGAPTTCAAQTARPFSKTKTLQSLDGGQVQVCALAFSTCLAREQFRSTSCDASTGSGCGHGELEDGLCRAVESASEGSPSACTMACGSSVDCPSGFACNVNESPPFCDLTSGTCYGSSDCASGVCVDGACVQ